MVATEKQFVTELRDHVSSSDGQWTVKGFIDIFKNVYTISSDTKIVSKILEIHLFPKILAFAQANGYKVVLAEHQNYYPDISLVKADDESVRFAVDFKTTYRNPIKPHLCNGFTLGSHGEYFENRTSTKNIQFPYGSYSGHFCLGIIYDRAEGATIDETKAHGVDELHSITSVARNFHFFVTERMNIKVGVPPIKSQGIKTKLVPWIQSILPSDFNGTWIEPFMGTGAVAFNVAPRRAILCDTNPHLINFYASIASGEITPEVVKEFLTREGEALFSKGEDHYYFVRDRFNAEHSPLDFLFVNRAGFNGMIRFNRKGGFNIPFCRKPQRFAQAYVTKITNQVAWAAKVIQAKKFTFKCQDFNQTIEDTSPNDIIYCDPPYIDRHVDYYNGWDDAHERELFSRLSGFGGKFILSTWHHNDYRENEYVKSLWSKHHVLTREHFYHVGGKEENRNPVVEALVTNFAATSMLRREESQIQYILLEPPAEYVVA